MLRPFLVRITGGAPPLFFERAAQQRQVARAQGDADNPATSHRLARLLQKHHVALADVRDIHLPRRRRMDLFAHQRGAHACQQLPLGGQVVGGQPDRHQSIRAVRVPEVVRAVRRRMIEPREEQVAERIAARQRDQAVLDGMRLVRGVEAPAARASSGAWSARKAGPSPFARKST